MENLPWSGWPTKITPRTHRQLDKEVTKEPRTTKALQTSLASVKVSVHDSTIRKRLGKNGIHGRVPRRKPLLTKKNKESLSYNCHKTSWWSQDFWENILWTDETKVDLFGRSASPYIRHNTNTAFWKKKIIPAVKHGGRSVMVWGCFAASESERLAVIDGTMKSGRIWTGHQDGGCWEPSAVIPRMLVRAAGTVTPGMPYVKDNRLIRHHQDRDFFF